MDVVYRLRDVVFEWDADKAQRNIHKHGITFEEAAQVFFDIFAQIGDASVDDFEERDFVIGYTFRQRLLLTVYVERGTHTRLISARPATHTERKFYESRIR